MTYASVDHAVLQAGAAYGAMTDYNMFAQMQYPAKFTALAHLDEALAWETSRLAHRESAAGQGVKGIYFNFAGPARDGFSTPMRRSSSRCGIACSRSASCKRFPLALAPRR